jgi:N-acetyl-gamma-glutamyl-phosphate reductase
VIFTPHLAPLNRGILATCYARPAGAAADVDAVAAAGAAAGAAPGSDLDPLGVLLDFYAGEPFVVVSARSPSTKAALGSNTAHLTARYDERSGWIIAICALDNLVKGASGQAIQCANLAVGLPEATGLPSAGLYP